MNATEVMTPDVITVCADTPVNEFACLLLEGIVARADILRLLAQAE